MDEKKYFDAAASSVPDREILEKAFNESLEFFGNPSSLHQAGKAAKRKLEEARERAAEALGVDGENLYFTSGATEANAMSFLAAYEKKGDSTVLISAGEHSSVYEQPSSFRNAPFKTSILPVDRGGFVSEDALRASLTDDVSLIHIQSVNNETGAVQNIEALAAVLQERRKRSSFPRLHVDAVQAVGKIPLSLSLPFVSSASVSAHKIGGARGVGAFYSKTKPLTFLAGGAQERNVRSGTENLFGALSLSYALEKRCIKEGNEAHSLFLERQRMSARFIARLAEIPHVYILPKERIKTQNLYSPWIVCFAVRGIPGEVLLRYLDDLSFAVSTSSACSSSKKEHRTLRAMKVEPALASSAVRVSFSYTQREEDDEALLLAVRMAVEKFL